MAGDSILTLCTFSVGLVAVEVCRRASLRYDWLDRPGARSSHTTPTPRIGGVGVVIVVALAVLALFLFGWKPSREVTALLLGVGATAVVGMLDDLFSLSAIIRFVLQITIASGVVIGGAVAITAFDDGALGRAAAVASSVAWLVWLTNLYNFMDGSDGLAAGQAIVAFIAFDSVLGRADVHVVALAFAGATAAFLIHNIAPARIFMGDALSTSLGFAFGVLGLLATRLPHGFPWLGVLPLYIFIADATVTLVRRAISGEKFWRAHRKHAYQLLIQQGWSHRGVQMLYLALAAGVAVIAIAWSELTTTTATMTVVILHVLLALGFIHVWRVASRKDRAEP